MRYKPDEEEELLIIERITIFFAPQFEKRTCNPSVEKYIFIRRSLLLLSFEKSEIRGAEVAETGGEERRVRWSSLDREYRRDTLEISRRIRIIRRRVKQEGDERIVPLVSEIQSMCRIECR